MIEKLINFFLSQRLFTIAMTILLMGIGLWSLLHLPVDSFPDVSNVQVQIVTEPETMSAEEIEMLVTFPIENALNGLPNIKLVRSNSSYGLSVVTAIFDDSTDVYFARQLVQQRLNNVELPAESPKPILGPVISTFSNVFSYYLESPSRSITELRTLQDWTVALRLRAVSGVGSVVSFGGYEKEYQVILNPSILTSHGLTPKQVADAVAANNENAGGKFIEQAGQEIIIRGVGRIETKEDIEDIVLKSVNGTPIKIGQVANVIIGTAFRRGAASINGNEEAVTGLVYARKDANSKTVVEKVKERIKEIQHQLPSDVRITAFYDQSALVDSSIHTVEEVLTISSSLVITVLFALLLNIRSALIVALIIPLSLLFSFIMMKQAGLSANIMTLGAVDFGVIVDSGVVMVENALRHFILANESTETAEKATGRLRTDAERSHRELVKKSLNQLTIMRFAAAEVGQPIVFAITIIAAVFLPLFFLEDVEGRMFRPLAMTYIFALMGALIASLTIIPVLSYFFLRNEKHERRNFALDWLKNRLTPILNRAIAHPVKTIAAASTLFILTLFMVPFLGSEFVPALDEGSILLRVKLAPSVSLNESRRIMSKVERMLIDFPEVDLAVARIGRSGAGADLAGVDSADIHVSLKSKDTWKRSKEQLIEAMDAKLSHIPGLLYSFSQPIADNIDDLVAGIRADVGVKIFGNDPETLEKLAQQITTTAKTVRGACDIQKEHILGLPELNLKLNRRNIARYGLNIKDVQDIIRIAIAGQVVTDVIESPKRYGLLVRYPISYRAGHLDLENLMIDAPSGAKVALKDLADFSDDDGLVMINRENGERRTAVLCNVRERDLGSFVNEFQNKVEKEIKLPRGYRIVWGGQFENQQRAMLRLALVVPVVLLLIFVLLLASFHSVRNVLVVMLNIPFALIGGIVALMLCRVVVSVPAIIGFIALFGVAVQNGVIMVTYMMHLQRDGYTAANAARHGAEIRLRPVVMTALVAIVGFFPLLISHSTGSEVQKPLAIVVTGGLLTATPLTLLVLPAAYALFNTRRRKRRKSKTHQALSIEDNQSNAVETAPVSI